MKKIIVTFFLPFLLLASGDSMVLYPILSGVLFAISLFFWGIYKLVKTQRNIYILVLLPFIALLFAMFFIR